MWVDGKRHVCTEPRSGSTRTRRHNALPTTVQKLTYFSGPSPKQSKPNSEQKNYSSPGERVQRPLQTAAGIWTPLQQTRNVSEVSPPSDTHIKALISEGLTSLQHDQILFTCALLVKDDISTFSWNPGPANSSGTYSHVPLISIFSLIIHCA